MSLEPFVLALREKSQSELTLDSSDFSVPSISRWWSNPTRAVLHCMNSVIMEQVRPRSLRNADTVFLERATPGCISERKLSS
jgi:hypothetical protein